MAKFFIDRPIFAWVITLFIMVLGLVSITQLPISQYPPVAPPTIIISATYPGASAETLDQSVLSVIEREMNGSPGLAYIESTSQANGTGQISISFEPGTNPNLAQVDVQNRLSRAAPRLPASVNQQGADYVSRNVLPEIQRVPGVGQAQLFASERAMRIWLDPAKLTGFNLAASDVNAAIQAQNAQVSSGSIGELPTVSDQAISATVIVPGQLASVKEFGNIVLPTATALPCGSRTWRASKSASKATLSPHASMASPLWLSACSLRPRATHWPRPKPCAPNSGSCSLSFRKA